MSYKLKVVLVGPCQSGKTLLANFLADATENPSEEEYRPTHVVRILEFESNVNVNGRYVKTDIELWDSSGNPGFKSCWPAIVWETHGVIFVFNPEEDQQARDLETFYDQYIGNPNSSIQDNQCIVFANVKSKAAMSRKPKLASKFNRIPQLEINLESEATRLRSDFNTFLSTIVANLTERHEQGSIL